MKILITNGTLKGHEFDVVYKDGDIYKIDIRTNPYDKEYLVSIHKDDCVVVV